MSTLVESRSSNRIWTLSLAGAAWLIVAAISVPNLVRVRMSPEQLHEYQEHNQAYHGADSLAKSQTLMSTALEMAPPPPPAPLPGSAITDRKMVRTIALEMTVANPIETAQTIQAFAAGLGGYVESSQVSTQNAPAASVTIRVPAAKLDDAESGLRKMAIRVDSEKTDTQDVTKQYVDMDARLRNLRAEETQYLQIMKSAVKVKDMLDVSEKLSDVRGEIEQQQAEFATLSKQVETVAITIALQAQADADVLGFHWRPLYQVKLAAHDALDGLANYVATITAVILYLPVILLWSATILVGALIAWRIVRWAGRAFFGWPPTVAASTH